MSLEPEKPQKPLKAEIDFIGMKISIPRKDYESIIRLLAIEDHRVMLHDILTFAHDSDLVYLQSDFRAQLIQAIQYTAGDTPIIQQYFATEKTSELSEQEFKRLVRINVAEMSREDVIENLPNVPLRIGDMRVSVEGFIQTINHGVGKDKHAPLADFLSPNLLKGARFATLRFFSTYLDSLDQDER
ncbi:MAG: hypothetical protein KDD62_05675 [Bdellovibrionales bacterium]|nr:hypothetical protein [Bdellovibrionales bacterium]